MNRDKEGKELKIKISKECIREFQTNLNEFKSVGPDKIPARLLKELSEKSWSCWLQDLQSHE